MSICAGCGNGLHSDRHAVALGQTASGGGDWEAGYLIRVCPRCLEALVFNREALKAIIKEIVS